MFDSFTSAEYTSQMWKSRGRPSRFQTSIMLLNTFFWSTALIGRTIAHPSTILIVAAAVLLVLEIPMVSFTVLRMSSNAELRERWSANRPPPMWVVRLTSLFFAATSVWIICTWIGLLGKNWDHWLDIAFPFIFLFMSFDQSNADWDAAKEIREENVAERRRRWAFAYKLGRRAGPLFSTSVQNIPTI